MTNQGYKRLIGQVSGSYYSSVKERTCTCRGNFLYPLVPWVVREPAGPRSVTLRYPRLAVLPCTH